MTYLRTLLALTLLATASFGQAPPALQVDGGNGHSATLTAADLAGLPQQGRKRARSEH